MEFGRVTPAILDRIDLSLPAEPALNQQMLKGQPVADPAIYIGGVRWGNADWVGPVYPSGTKAADFLKAYARIFNCVEHNATFYKIPSEQQVLSWKAKVDSRFRFCPKFPEVITHIKRLSNCTDLVDLFLHNITCLGDNLGPLFLMPHPQMGVQQWGTIANFLESLPIDLPLFVEFRHPSFFVQGISPLVLDSLSSLGVGLVITDAVGRRDCTHMHLSVPKVFIRFVGNNLHASDYRRIDHWVARIHNWLQQGLEEVYFFIHQQDELQSPLLAKYLIQQLNTVCGLHLPLPQFGQEQPIQKGLFD
jgi:uncharacterized protein YecE (DUF72 family)